MPPPEGASRTRSGRPRAVAPGRKPGALSSESVTSAQANAPRGGFAKNLSATDGVSIRNFGGRESGSEIGKYGWFWDAAPPLRCPARTASYRVAAGNVSGTAPKTAQAESLSSGRARAWIARPLYLHVFAFFEDEPPHPLERQFRLQLGRKTVVDLEQRPHERVGVLEPDREEAEACLPSRRRP